MKFNGLKVGDIVRPNTNDVNNVDHVTMGSTYVVTRLYVENGFERMDIDSDEYIDESYTMEEPKDFNKVCKTCGH